MPSLISNMGKIIVTLRPEDRKEYLKALNRLWNLNGITENPKQVYLPVPMTGVPENLIEKIREKIKKLKGILEASGLEVYNPYTGLYTEFRNWEASPREVTLHDYKTILASRYLVALNVTASTGAGMEKVFGELFNKVVVDVSFEGIAISKMQPLAGIRISVSNLEEQTLTSFFRFIQDFEPGLGYFDGSDGAVLLGFQGGKVYPLEQKVWEEFPDLRYSFNADAERIKTTCLNPDKMHNL